MSKIESNNSSVIVPSGVLRDSSVGEQDIDPALFLFDLCEELIEIVEVRHISLNGGNIFSDLFDRRIQFRLTTPSDKDVRTLIYKPLPCGKADAAVATGDKRNLSLKLTQAFLVSCHFPV
jgi:hypothetical protein